MNNSRSEIDFVYYQTLFVFFNLFLYIFGNSFFFLLESQLRLHYSTLFLHLYKARQPQSGAFDTVVLTPYIIPILGLNRPVSSRLCRAFCGRDGYCRQDGRRPEGFIPFFYPDHLLNSSFTIHCNRLCSLVASPAYRISNFLCPVARIPDVPKPRNGL